MVNKEPFDRAWNVCVQTIANRLFPQGFDLTPDPFAVDTLEKLSAYVERYNRMLVWNGASDSTVFACDETNFAFRAWHDWHHWRHAIPFTFAGEVEVCARQKTDIVKVFGLGSATERFCRLLDAEVVGQALHYERYGAFPINQFSFTRAYLDNALVCLSRDWSKLAA